jgi:biotin operon repressor
MNLEKKVFTYGLSEEENAKVRKALPSKEYRLIGDECITSALAKTYTAVILNADAMVQDEIDEVRGYYLDIGCCTDETMIWLGSVPVPAKMKSYVKAYPDFCSIEENLKFLLLTAHRKTKKVEGHSRMLADSLLILAMVRKFPGISTQQLVERTGISERSVQRYIKSIQATGEWLEYNRSKRGWELQYGKSLLFGDVWED